MKTKVFALSLSAILVGIVVLLFTSTPLTSAQEGPDMGFVEDVTIPDDTVIDAGSAFTKTWKLENTGDVNWTDKYGLTFVDGEPMAAITSTLPFTRAIPPEEVVELSVAMTAPQEDGTYTSWWRLTTPEGGEVGGSFYVQIVVDSAEQPQAPDATQYSMDEEFELGGWKLRVTDLYRNKRVWQDKGLEIVARGQYAISRIAAVNTSGYSIVVDDKFDFWYVDEQGNVYDQFNPDIAYAATRYFNDNFSADESDNVPPGREWPIIITYAVPEETRSLHLFIKDIETGQTADVHVRPLMSKKEQRYDGEFIDAPERTS
jgi:hypothetical protein